jgi:hypothetical protein
MLSSHIWLEGTCESGRYRYLHHRCGTHRTCRDCVLYLDATKGEGDAQGFSREVAGIAGAYRHSPTSWLLLSLEEMYGIEFSAMPRNLDTAEVEAAGARTVDHLLFHRWRFEHGDLTEYPSEEAK